MTKLIYVGGYGHSGSTLLEYLMTGVPTLVACGEVAGTTRPGTALRTCTCGQPTAACPIWSFIAGPTFDPAQYDHEALDELLLKRAAADYAAMVDSTKTAWRASTIPFTMRRKLGAAFHLVHIVRDPRAVCWSLLKRDKRVGEMSNGRLLVIETLLGLYYANLACELFARRYPNEYTRLRYEDLCSQPVVSMTNLMIKLLPTERWSFEAIGAQDNRHQLYANRMRADALPLESIELDDAWRRDMPDRVRRIVQTLSAPLSRRYGYEAFE